ncbi:MAG: hypothetical protein CME63_01565 [Halobacteriovoraceae bacterium]|nr:hypothetical protein [Halobacteriovoraceae bacterium]|tara:strand:+ start:35042 stop:35305 length:264 start_codon:yes stop_codon:yes gene_type:complete
MSETICLDRILKFKVDGIECSLREPTMTESGEFANKAKEAKEMSEEESLRAIKDFLITLGATEEFVNKLSFRQLNLIQTKLSEKGNE